MDIKIPTSLGELIDKISILLIKKKNINEAKKLLHIKKELKDLQKVLIKLKLNRKIINLYLKKMVNVNTKLWKIEDSIRTAENNNKFDIKFINLARSVYKNNDLRAKIKLEINKKFKSEIIEVKSYKDYKKV